MLMGFNGFSRNRQSDVNILNFSLFNLSIIVLIVSLASSRTFPKPSHLNSSDRDSSQLFTENCKISVIEEKRETLN